MDSTSIPQKEMISNKEPNENTQTQKRPTSIVGDTQQTKQRYRGGGDTSIKTFGNFFTQTPSVKDGDTTIDLIGNTAPSKS